MFRFKNKNTSGKQPKKKIIKWILIGVAILFFFIIIGSGDSDDGIPTLEDELSEYLEPYSQDSNNGVTMLWYKIEQKDLSRIKDYVDLLCDDYDFETVDGKDNDYYLYYNGDTDALSLYTDKNNKEYHIRIGIGDEGEDQSIICFIYADGIFDSAEKADEDKTEQNGKTDKDSEGTKNQGKEDVIVSEINTDFSAGSKQSKASVSFQSAFDFLSPVFTFEKESESQGMIVQKFKGSSKNVAFVKEYVNLLCSDAMNFEKTIDEHDDYSDVYLASYDEDWDFGFTYTGSASIEEKCTTVSKGNSQKFAVTIYCKTDGDDLTGTINWVKELDSCDLGFRIGGKNESTEPGGKSALTGLIRTSDGKYKTTDGRFSAGINEVIVTVNGNSQKGSFEYVDNTPNGGDEIKIQSGDGSKLYTVIFPRSCVQKTGMLYDHNDLLQEYHYPLIGDPRGDLGEDTIVYQFIDSKWITAVYKNSPCKDMTFRVMYYNEAEQIAVYYIYTYFTAETEAFCVVDLSKANKNESQNSSGGGVNVSVPTLNNNKNSFCNACGNDGKIKCNNCNERGKVVIIGSTPGYGTDVKKSYKVEKDCTFCRDGYKDCDQCNN